MNILPTMARFAPRMAIAMLLAGSAIDRCGAGIPETGWKWRQLESSPPLNDFECGVAFDIAADQLVLWGGHSNFGGPKRADTWLFDPGNEEWELAEPANRPVAACCVRDIVYDAANRRTYFLGGSHYIHGWSWRAPLDRAEGYPWAYDAERNIWRCTRPLVWSTSPWTGGVYHAGAQVLLTYGGQYIPDRSVWAYDGYTNEWTEIPRSGDGPPPAGIAAPLGYDPDRDIILYFTGAKSGDGVPVWQFDLSANRWEKIEAAGAPERSYNIFIFDHLNRVPILFGRSEGKMAAFALDYDAQRWKELTVEGEPPPGYTIPQAGYDPKRHRTIFANGASYNVRNRRAVYVFEHAKPESAIEFLQPPGDVAALSTAAGAVEISFRPVEGAERYEVHRGSGDRPWRASYHKLGEVRAGKFLDPHPARDAINYYYVRAIFSGGRAADSLKVRAQPRAPQQPVVSVLDEKRIEIAWPTSAEADVVGYNIYEASGGGQREQRGLPQSGRSARWKQGITEVRLKKLNDAPLKEPAFVIAFESLPRAGESDPRYVVRAVNRLGVESGSSPWVDTFASEPTGVIARTENGKPVVTWNPNPEKGIAGYYVHRLNGGNDAARIAGPITGTRFVDETRTERGRCKYYIVPIDAAGREGRASYGAWLDGGYN